MKLTHGEKIGIITAFGVVIASAIIHIGIREWYAPDIRYEEGSYYISGSTAVTSLKLKNYGHADAEDIIMTAKFNKPLTEISIDDPSITFTNISGGEGQLYVCGKVPRLVSGQEIFIYLAIDNSSPISGELPKSFLSQLTFKGGKGKTGRPIWGSLFFGFIVFLVYALIFFVVCKFPTRGLSRHYVKIDEVIELANAAISEDISRDIFESRLSKYLKDTSFRKETLQKIALKVFDSRQTENDGD